MIKYRTGLGKFIAAIEVVRDTPKMVVFSRDNGTERKEAKRSNWGNWHDTWEDAHEFLLSRAEQDNNRR